jgi:hypothetical protein
MFEFRFSNFKFFPKDLLGQAGQSIDIPELLLFDACRGELRINEAEPDGWCEDLAPSLLFVRGVTPPTCYLPPPTPHVRRGQ